jgi:hypothetical protein
MVAVDGLDPAIEMAGMSPDLILKNHLPRAEVNNISCGPQEPGSGPGQEPKLFPVNPQPEWLNMDLIRFTLI